MVGVVSTQGAGLTQRLATSAPGVIENRSVVRTERPPISSGATPKTPSGRPQSRFRPTNDSSDFCFCTKRVYLMERMSANGFFFHRTCFRCSHCGCQLKIGGYSLSKGVGGEKGKFFCNAHYRQLFLSNPEAINYSRAGVPKRQTSSEEVSGPKAKPLTSPEVIENGTTSPQSMDSSSFTTPPSTPSTPPPEKHSKRSKGSRFFSRKEKGKSKKSQSASPEPVEEEGGKERASSAEPELTVEVEESAPELKSFVRLRTSQSGNVQRLSRGFENLEAEARADEEINPFDRVSSVRSQAPTSLAAVSEAQPSPAAGPPPTSTIPSLQVLQKALTPVSGKWYQFGIHLGIKSPELHRVEKKCLGRPEGQFLEELLVLWLEKGVPAPSWRVVVTALKKVEETGLAAQLERKHGLSQRQWTGRGVWAHQIEDTLHIPRSSNLRPERRRRGQQSAVRSFGSAYSTSDVAMQDRQRQQQRFREAQLNQREMSQLERQYEELEEYGRQIEETLRDTESTSQEDQFMKKWLNLVNERNGLVRKTAELSLKMKELALEDQQYEIEKELNCLFGHPDLSEEEHQHFEDLLEQKIQVVNERDALVIQTDEERKREIEEDETRGLMMDEQFGLGRTSSQSSLTPDGSPSLAQRRPSQPEAYVESILRKDLEHKKRRARSWWGTK